MTLPSDPELTKLRILKERAERKHAIALEAVREAERAAWEEVQKLMNRRWARCRELGYCSACELPLAECEGHAGIAAASVSTGGQPPAIDGLRHGDVIIHRTSTHRVTWFDVR